MSLVRALLRQAARSSRDNLIGAGLGGVSGAYAAHEQGFDDPLVLMAAFGLGAGAGGGAGVLAGPYMRAVGRRAMRGANDGLLRQMARSSRDNQRLLAESFPRMQRELRQMQQRGADPADIEDLRRQINEARSILQMRPDV